jgi:hypothetical protein
MDSEASSEVSMQGLFVLRWFVEVKRAKEQTWVPSLHILDRHGIVCFYVSIAWIS